MVGRRVGVRRTGNDHGKGCDTKTSKVCGVYKDS